MPADRRPPRVSPPRFPPPQFPPHRPALFATTPPAIFPPILGLLGTVLALRRAAEFAGQGGAVVELLAGAALALWLFAVVALKLKVLRRMAVLREDMRPIPGRAGLAAASMSGMAAGALLAPYLPLLALALLLASLLAHAILLGVLLAELARLPVEQRGLNPTLHLSFVGFIVAAGPLAKLGWTGTAMAIFWVTGAAALAIWAGSLVQLARQVPPAPLRPLLAIHLAPAALLSASAMALGMTGPGQALAALALLIGIALLAGGRWIAAAGFSPMWGAFTFPLAALASALVLQGDRAGWAGVALALVALGVNGWIAWSVLKLWPGNRLAQKTGAAEA